MSFQLALSLLYQPRFPNSPARGVSRGIIQICNCSMSTQIYVTMAARMPFEHVQHSIVLNYSTAHGVHSIDLMNALHGKLGATAE
jgi:uncharacterized membrane protein (DUF485 family)